MRKKGSSHDRMKTRRSKIELDEQKMEIILMATVGKIEYPNKHNMNNKITFLVNNQVIRDDMEEKKIKKCVQVHGVTMNCIGSQVSGFRGSESSVEFVYIAELNGTPNCPLAELDIKFP